MSILQLQSVAFVWMLNSYSRRWYEKSKKFAMCIFLSRLAYIPLYCCDLLNVRTLAHIPVHPVGNMIFNCLPPQNQKKSATAIVFSSVSLCGLLFMLTVLLYYMGHMHTRQTTPSNLYFIVCGIAPTIGSLNNVVITGSLSSLPPVSTSTSLAVSGYKLLGFLSRSVAHFSNPSNNLNQLLSKAKPSICGEPTASCRSVTFFIFVPLSFLVRSALISPTTSKVPIVSSSNTFSCSLTGGVAVREVSVQPIKISCSPRHILL